MKYRVIEFYTDYKGNPNFEFSTFYTKSDLIEYCVARRYVRRWIMQMNHGGVQFMQLINGQPDIMKSPYQREQFDELTAFLASYLPGPLYAGDLG